MSNRYRDRDQYERSRPQYNKLRDNSYRSQHTHNDYYRSPTSSSARGGGYRNQDKGYSSNYNQRSNYNSDSKYNNGYSSNYNKDYNNGYSSNYDKDYNNGYSSNYDKDYNNGYSSNYDKDYNNGYSSNYNKDYKNGYSSNYDKDYNNGYSSNYNKDYNNGYASNYDKDYNNGYASNNNKDYNNGYSNNYNKDYNKGYNDDYGNYDDVVASYANGSTQGIVNPSLAGTKPLSAGQTPKSEKVRSVFLNPKVRQQLEDNSKKYTPYFIYFVTGIQVIVLLVSYILNYKNTSSVIADLHENFFIGPDTGTLITMGARYIPCMKDSEFSGECPYGIRGTVSPTTIPVKESGKVDENGKDQGKIGTLLKGAYYCSQNDICGFGGMKNQWFRFITAIFVHSGIAHIAFNLIFQIRTGLSLERDFGTWRIAIIYMASGIFGFIFEAKSLGNIPTVGCSGALYGLLACILLDLIQNWKLVVHPIRDLIKLIVIIILSFSIGFLPYFDNFAHIGGFIMGFLTGLIFLPSIAFSENGGRIKKILQFVAIVVSVFLFFWEIKSFYNNEDGCEWCKNLNCAPFIDKCKN